jgi:hypothetical protein
MLALFKSGSFLYADCMSLFTWSELITVGAPAGAAPAAVVPDALVPVPLVLPVAVELGALPMLPVVLSADPAWLPTFEGAPLLGLVVLDCGAVAEPVFCALRPLPEVDDCGSLELLA